MFALYAELGYPTHFVSAKTAQGIEALRARVQSKTSAFVGASGVGKSSLLNALDERLALATRETSASLDKGKHTTRVAELHRIAETGWVADTPGIRELASFRLPRDELDGCFVEFRPHLGRCRFGSCAHEHEPDCAIKAAVAEGAIDADRYDSYLRIRADESR